VFDLMATGAKEFALVEFLDYDLPSLVGDPSDGELLGARVFVVELEPRRMLVPSAALALPPEVCDRSQLVP
jgi:hypothetical protein